MIHHSLLLREHVHVLTVSLSVLSKALYTKLHVEWWWRITYSFSAQMRFSSMQHRCYEVSSFSSELKILSFFSCVVSSSQIFWRGMGGWISVSVIMLWTDLVPLSLRMCLCKPPTLHCYTAREKMAKNKAQSWKEIEWWTGLYRCMVSYKWLSLMNIWWAKWWNQLTP